MDINAEIMDIPTIPEFTWDDFTTTTKPFEFVAQYRNDDLQMSQLEAIVAKKAKSLGISNFKSMFKRFMKKKYPRQKTIYTNLTEFSGQKLELSCGSYFCSDNGISIDNNRDDYGIDVCNHPIMPIQRLVNIDDNTEKLQIAYKKGGRWREIIVDKETLASSNKILSLAKYGVAVNSENAKYLIKYLTDIEDLNYDILEELSSVGRLGWIEGKGFSPYVEGLVFDGTETFRHLFACIHPQGSFETWLMLLRKIRKEKGSTVARIQTAASFASVLVEKCDCLPFFLHLWGGSEAGKTVGLMLAASVWANPPVGEYIFSFNSTNVAQELNATFLNSLPLMLDELQIVKDKNSFDKMIYTLAEGVGRVRGQKTGGLQKVGTWRNCIMTTGEFPINNASSGGGAVNRVIEIDCKGIKLFENHTEVLDVINRNFGFAGKKFVQFLQETDINVIRARRKEIYEALLDNSDITEKQANSASLILLADELTERVIFMDGVRLTVNDIKPYLSTKDQIDQNRRCLDYIYEIIAVNGSKFAGEANSQESLLSETWGVSSIDTIYIIKSVFDKLLRDAGYNSTAFLSWAKTKEYIKSSSGHNTVTKRINGTVCRCVALLVSELTEALTGDKAQNNILNGDDDLPF